MLAMYVDGRYLLITLSSNATIVPFGAMGRCKVNEHKVKILFLSVDKG